MDTPERPLHLETKLIHGSCAQDQTTGATSTPIIQSTAFAYGSAEELESVFAGREAGFVYRRDRGSGGHTGRH